MPTEILGDRMGREDYGFYPRKQSIRSISIEQLTWVYGGYVTLPGNYYAVWTLTSLLDNHPGYRNTFYEISVSSNPATLGLVRMFQYSSVSGYTEITRKFFYENTVLKLRSGYRLDVGSSPSVVIENKSPVTTNYRFTFKGLLELV